MLKYYLIAITAVILTAISQVLLKKGAMYGHRHVNLLKSYLNVFAISGYCLLFLVTVLNTYAYTNIPLRMAIVFLPMTFIMVVLLSFKLLKEQFTWSQWIGAAIIIVGIVIYNI